MSELLVIGLSHRSAEVSLREQLALEGQELQDTLKRWAQTTGEAAILSTCNRVEFYAATDDVQHALKWARQLMAERAPSVDLGAALYSHSGTAAVEHMFRVAASLDSLVVGEPQILGQIKSAYDIAGRMGTVGTLLGRCLTRSFAVAKRVRTETGIAEGAVSVSSIATSLAKKIFGDLTGRRVVLVGAGEMGEASAKSLSNTGAQVHVLNRSFDKAVKVAGTCGGQARAYEQLASELVNADVVITTTASPRPILTQELMRGVTRARRHRPLFLIDIAVPRDIDPRVGELQSVFLYDVDDLQQVANENLSLRKKAAETAEHIVVQEAAEFDGWRRSLVLTPTIVGLRNRFGAIVAGELEKTADRLDLGEDERRILRKMENALVNKLLHGPLTALKGQSDARLIAATRRLFSLDEDEAEAPQTSPRISPQSARAPSLSKEQG